MFISKLSIIMILISFLVSCYIFVFFFFQAEDGIRDLTVTGVQTCALPISSCPTCWALSWCLPRSTSRSLRSEEHTSELQSQSNLVCRLLLEKKKKPMTYSGLWHAVSFRSPHNGRRCRR